jgi:hypothetical protein
LQQLKAEGSKLEGERKDISKLKGGDRAKEVSQRNGQGFASLYAWIRRKDQSEIINQKSKFIILPLTVDLFMG